MAPTETPVSQETPVTQTPQSTQDVNREALYQQYYGTPTGDTPASDAPVTPVESAAPAEPVDAPVAPIVAQLPPEALQFMQQVTAELADLRSKVAPTPTVPITAPEEVFVNLLREGKVKEAIDVLAVAVAAKNSSQLTQDTLNQTREVMRAESEIDRFTTDLRTTNPELVPMERLIAADAQDRMVQARASGRVRTTDDAVREYKTAVTEAVTSARKLYHTLRGDGKSEAQVRQREVLSSRPVSPQQTDTSRPQVTGVDVPEPPVDTTSDYLRKRGEIANWQKGLAPKPNFL